MPPWPVAGPGPHPLPATRWTSLPRADVGHGLFQFLQQRGEHLHLARFPVGREQGEAVQPDLLEPAQLLAP